MPVAKTKTLISCPDLRLFFSICRLFVFLVLQHLRSEIYTNKLQLVIYMYIAPGEGRNNPWTTEHGHPISSSFEPLAQVS